VFAKDQPAREKWSTAMHHYLIHHKSKRDSRDYTVDCYHNDPYVWHDPYMWSFCRFHRSPRPTVEPGSVIVWLTRPKGKNHHSDPYFCDLVFVVGNVMELEKARTLYGKRDRLLDCYHFEQGLATYPHADLTCVADMTQSFIPHPAIEVSSTIDALWGKSLSNVWDGGQKSFLLFDEQHMRKLVGYIKKQIQQPLCQQALSSDITDCNELKDLINKKKHPHHGHAHGEHSSPHRKHGTC
jgi:hypothetical protein